MEAIVSLQRLSWLLGVPLEKLVALAARSNASYRVTRRPDRKGKLRTYEIPNAELMAIQRRIVRVLLSLYELSPMAHGGVTKRSPRTNAEAHLGKELLVEVDVRDCFPSIRHKQVFAMFRRDFGFGDEVSSVLTSLTTFKGHLPQGAATSPAIANALMTKLVDGPLETAANELGVVPTRYIDNVNFSGRNARALINVAARNLSRVGLAIHRKRKKLKILPNRSLQTVTGLVVNDRKKAHAGKKRIENIRAAIHQFGALARSERALAVESIRGRIAYIRQFNKGAAARLQRQFQAVMAQAT